ncbi:2421_t:CDS:2 [Acaulospora morrowiae]|uniref:2421_t:CDS:1 n=1 Tax=Acaulospora morrowiae TaxID=94023 RepID=A0A9N9A1S2_9GLOM|nr:2421_t:CDS:2 [Acaulospora morrowiae]
MTVNNDDNTTFFLLSEEELDQLTQIIIPIILVSIIASAIMSVVFILIRIYYPPLADRVSFRLGFATMVSDLFYMAFQLVGNLAENEPGFMCSFMVWGLVSSSLMSVFFTACIAINLQTIFVHEYKGRRNLEKYYFIFSIGMALLLSFLPLTQNMLGFDVPEQVCWYKDSGMKYNIIWQWATLFGWIELCVLYCAIIVITVVIKLYFVASRFEKTLEVLPITDPSKDELKKFAKKSPTISMVVRRVLWYPVVPIITQTPNWLVETSIYLQQRASYSMFLVCFVAIAMQGLLNALVFSQDIAVTRAIQLKKLNWWYNYVNAYEQKYPHLSKNKRIESSKKSRTDSSNNNTNVTDILPEQLSEKMEIVRKSEGSESASNPTFLEKLRYTLLVKLFSTPEETDLLISLQHTLSSIDETKPEPEESARKRKFLSLPVPKDALIRSQKFLSLQMTSLKPSTDPEQEHKISSDFSSSPTVTPNFQDSSSDHINPPSEPPTFHTNNTFSHLTYTDLLLESTFHAKKTFRHSTIGAVTPNYALIGDENPLPMSKLLQSPSLRRNKKTLSINSTKSPSNRPGYPSVANKNTNRNNRGTSLTFEEINEESDQEILSPSFTKMFNKKPSLEYVHVLKKL